MNEVMESTVAAHQLKALTKVGVGCRLELLHSTSFSFHEQTLQRHVNQPRKQKCGSQPGESKLHNQEQTPPQST